MHSLADVDWSTTFAPAVVDEFLLLLNEMMKNGLRDVDVDGVDVGFVCFVVAFAVADVFAAVAAAAAVDFAVAVDAVFAVTVVILVGFSVGDANARVLVDFDLIGATFAVIPNFETAEWLLDDDAGGLLSNNGTVSRDDVDDADFDFCDVYEANLCCSNAKPQK